MNPSVVWNVVLTVCVWFAMADEVFVSDEARFDGDKACGSDQLPRVELLGTPRVVNELRGRVVLIGEFGSCRMTSVRMDELDVSRRYGGGLVIINQAEQPDSLSRHSSTGLPLRFHLPDGTRRLRHAPVLDITPRHTSSSKIRDHSNGSTASTKQPRLTLLN